MSSENLDQKPLFSHFPIDSEGANFVTRINNPEDDAGQDEPTPPPTGFDDDERLARLKDAKYHTDIARSNGAPGARQRVANARATGGEDLVDRVLNDRPGPEAPTYGAMIEKADDQLKRAEQARILACKACKYSVDCELQNPRVLVDAMESDKNVGQAIVEALEQTPDKTCPEIIETLRAE